LVVVAGDIQETAPVDNVDFGGVVADYGNTRSIVDHRLVASTIVVEVGIVDPDKDMPYRPAVIMSEITRKQQWSDGGDWTRRVRKQPRLFKVYAISQTVPVHALSNIYSSYAS
jgi:hypothetical protein